MKSTLVTVIGFIATTLAVAPRLALAQTPSQGEPKWELGFNLGFVKAGAPQQGTASLPPQGDQFVFSGGSGRFVPSWFFGDGAKIVTANNAFNSLTGGIASLDSVLTSPSARVGGGFFWGVSLTRWFTHRWAVVGRVDMISKPFDLNASTLSAASSSAGAFRNAFDQLLSLQSSQRFVEATSTVMESGARISASVDLQFSAGRIASFRPYLIAGVGMVGQASPSATLTMKGRYEFIRLGVPFNETDTLSVRYKSANSAAIRFGGGVTRNIGRHYGVRAGVLIQSEPNKFHISIDSSPTLVAGSPTGIAVVPGGTSSIRFSTVPGTVSSLSGTLTGFETFVGHGWKTNVSFDGGIFFRF